ncbi:hypothetical protein tb265_13020 [Gemmatimonadetes bacterium T265]|nr:hypothetical protein tb265_13020 [Gemmatimonadetes bacterium T265]
MPRQIPTRALGAMSAALAFAAARPAAAQGDAHPGESPPGGSDVTVTGHTFQPKPLPAPDVSALHVPAGFRLTKFAEGLGNARVLAVSPAGRVYVTRRADGDVLMLGDDGTGRARGAPVRVASRPGLHGITFFGGKVYLVTVHEVYAADVLPDGHFGPLAMLIHDLPDAGQHNDRMVVVGPDSALYLSVGATCNECAEPNPENATILRAARDGSSRAIFASGLRNTIGYGFQPETGELWGWDQGMDWLGDDLPPEEFNHIEKGKRYGWPYFSGNNLPNPHRQVAPGGIPDSEIAKVSTPMVLGYTAHAAGMQLAFYAGADSGAARFPAEYRGDAFVSLRGSWNRKPPAGYEVVRVHFERGRPTSIRPFVTGFVTPDGEYGRPCGMAVARDGALLFTDDRNGVIYRVAYAGGAGGAPGASTTSATSASAAPNTPPAGPVEAQVLRGSGVPIAIRRPETDVAAGAAARLTVTSSAFADGAPIPAAYSRYEQNASIPLAWSAGPAGTRSYVLVMEDPDVPRPPVPVVHWLAWNVPAGVTALREGLQAQERLDDPPGLMQGPTSSGAPGYRGPRPPAGDPPHHYHVQLFALDRTLDLPLGADRDRVLAAMRGHVLARGELVGTFQRPAAPGRP